jgi:hypothetical protein
MQPDDDAQLSMMERRPWSKRLNKRLPLRYRDVLPSPTPAGPSSSRATLMMSTPISEQSTDLMADSAISTGIPSIGERIRHFFTTHRNKFGLYRWYHREGPPSHDPEENVTFKIMCDVDQPEVAPPALPSDVYYPYPNPNAFHLGDWYWNGGAHKSQESFKQLLEIIGDPDFSPTDVRDVKWDHINQTLADDANWTDEDGGWERTPVSILVPFQPRQNTVASHDAGAREYVVGDLYHRSLVEVVKEKLRNSVNMDYFHYEPYELNWRLGNSPEPIRVHGELYTSQAFIDAHNALQNTPPEPRCNLPHNIIALMFYSDSTHLTTFGDASLWLLYLYFGNESKYQRCKPSCHLANHVAYFRKVGSQFGPLSMSDSLVQLPDSFKDFAMQQVAGEQVLSDVFMTFCHRELMHAQWKILLDDEFIEAWTHGVVVMCCDGIEWRFYLRIFMHSGDYPEK